MKRLARSETLIEKVFRARWIFPILRPPIRNGWVMTRGNGIIALGQSESPPHGVMVEDLGDAAILPGLVNAHTHLEFSELPEPIGFTGIKLHDWISLVLQRRKKRGRDPGKVIAAGLSESLQTGVRLLGEIATTPWPGFRSRPALQVVAFAEILGLSPQRADEKIAAATAHLAKCAVASAVAGAVSPHAPYSTSLKTASRSVQLAVRHKCPVAMHLAESAEERELIEHGTGPFADKLKEMGIYQRKLFARGSDAVLQLLEMLAQAPSALVVHGNYLRSDELDFIAQHPHLTVVYCPRTHAFFNHPQHPVGDLLSRGAAVALGTDSRASNPDLSIWNEVRWLLEQRPDLDFLEVLAMATMHGANALLRPDLGRIAPGAQSGLIAVAGQAKVLEDLIPEWISGGSPRVLTSD